MLFIYHISIFLYLYLGKSMNESNTSSSSYLTPRPFSYEDNRVKGDEALQDCNGNRNEQASNDLVIEERREDDLRREVFNNEVPEMRESIGDVGAQEECCWADCDKESSLISTTSCKKSYCSSEKTQIENISKESVCEEEKKNEDCIEESREFGQHKEIKREKLYMQGSAYKNTEDHTHVDEKRYSSTAEELKLDIDDNDMTSLSAQNAASVLKDFTDSCLSQISNSTRDSVARQPHMNGDDEEGSELPGNATVEDIKNDTEALGLASNSGSNSVYTEESLSNRGMEFVCGDGSVVLDNSIDRERCSRTDVELETGDGDRGKPWQPNQATSTPKFDRSDSQCKKIFEGNFCGQAKHKDGSLLPIVFQVSKYECYSAIFAFLLLLV